MCTTSGVAVRQIKQSIVRREQRNRFGPVVSDSGAFHGLSATTANLCACQKELVNSLYAALNCSVIHLLHATCVSACVFRPCVCLKGCCTGADHRRDGLGEQCGCVD